MMAVTRIVSQSCLEMTIKTGQNPPRRIRPFADRLVTSAGRHFATTSHGGFGAIQIGCYGHSDGECLRHLSCIGNRRYNNRHGHILCIQMRQKQTDAQIPIQSDVKTNTKSSHGTQISSSKPLAPTLLKRRNKSKRKNHSFSAIKQITINHPKNSNPPTYATLTRKQFLRLSQKQRANLKQYLRDEQKASQSYLDKARTNVRSNLKFLKGTAETNLKKNIRTMKRLFNGEEVWNENNTMTPSKHTTNSTIDFDSLQWSKLPTAIRTNIKNNVTTMQDWLHRVTDGVIPSPNMDTSSSSVVTRLQKFHEMKQHQPLVMDNYWIAWNILLALLPGFMVHIYCLSKQDEMKEFYSELEKKERERISGGVISESSSDGMGLSSVLVDEGGSVWDKVKMAINDLFLGGLDEKIHVVDGTDAGDLNLDTTEISSPSETVVSSQSTTASHQRTTAHTSSGKVDYTSDKDMTIETLFKRIQVLEEQAGIKQHLSAQNETEQTNQSPLSKRRDNWMKSQWKKEEKARIDPAEEDVSSILQRLISSVKSWSQIDRSMTSEWLYAKGLELAGNLPFAIRAMDEPTNNQVVSKSNDEAAPMILGDNHSTTVSNDTTQLDRISMSDSPRNQDTFEPRWWSRVFRGRRSTVHEGGVDK